MLHNHAVEQRIFFMEQEQRLLKMMDRIYHKQMRFWTGDPEFQDPLIKEDLEGLYKSWRLSRRPDSGLLANTIQAHVVKVLPTRFGFSCSVRRKTKET